MAGRNLMAKTASIVEDKLKAEKTALGMNCIQAMIRVKKESMESIKVCRVYLVQRGIQRLC
jgi:hypothetical protein